ncbi:hypothetical protein BU16DRAFT_544673 [Lophium mytilinum]|uniref:Uncharacterized protein n=1 Tax=Lophium mytilinum TaxID=390894 RepID=A0A6A6QB35_9PEZI|nr:hypothetical protein BU16DRAFT_544673 [Lophium mytilinum]
MDSSTGRDVVNRSNLRNESEKSSNEGHEDTANQGQELEETIDDDKWVEQMLAEIAKVEEELDRIEKLIPQAQGPVSSHQAQALSKSTAEPPKSIDSAAERLTRLQEERLALEVISPGTLYL